MSSREDASTSGGDKVTFSCSYAYSNAQKHKTSLNIPTQQGLEVRLNMTKKQGMIFEICTPFTQFLAKFCSF